MNSTSISKGTDAWIITYLKNKNSRSKLVQSAHLVISAGNHALTFWCATCLSARPIVIKTGAKKRDTSDLTGVSLSSMRHHYVLHSDVLIWSEWRDLNPRHPAPKPMSEPLGRSVLPSLALSGAPAVPLWNSFALFVSGTAFVFWDLCGIEFCILKDVPSRVPLSIVQCAAQKMRHINKE